MAYALDTLQDESGESLTIATDPETAQPAIADVPASKTGSAKRLGIAKRGRALLLVKEHTVGKLVKQDDGSSKRDRSAGTEHVWKVTADLLDFRDARRHGLVS